MHMSTVFKARESEYVTHMCMNMFMIKNVFYRSFPGCQKIISHPLVTMLLCCLKVKPAQYHNDPVANWSVPSQIYTVVMGYWDSVLVKFSKRI